MNSFDANSALQRAVALQRSGKVAEAAAIYRQLVRSAPPNAQVLFLLGVAEMQLGNMPGAVQALRKSLALAPGQPRALCNLGTALHELGRDEEALASYDRAVALNPDYAMAYNNRGTALASLERPEDALASFERAIALEPRYVEAHNNRANTLRVMGKLEEALSGHDRAIALAPDYAAAHLNRGTVLIALCRPDEALASFDRAIALDRNHAAAHCGRATALYNLKRLDEANASNDRALALEPELAEAHWNRARLALTCGNLADGWNSFEWRRKLEEFAPTARTFPRPLWDGRQPIAGQTLLVCSEQGYGDIVQFCRYLPLVRACGAEAVLQAPKRLLPLLATLPGGVRLTTADEPLPEYDLCCPIMSLPQAFKTTLQTIPAEVPYLFADPQKSKDVAARLGAKTAPRIGLAWSGNAKQSVDRERSLALRRLEPLLKLPFEFHSLLKEIRPQDAEAMAAFPQIVRHEDEQHDFSDAAALIDGMDLVITTDTVIAHIAGAMAKPVWILLAWMPEWRWLLDRADSPWYPSATLFRQTARGDWCPVVADVAARLCARFARAL